MVIVTNLLIFIFSIFCFKQLSKFDQEFASAWGWFTLLIGISSCFGSTAHAVHYQLGKVFFDTIFYISNALSLVSIYYCFKGTYFYYKLNSGNVNRILMYFVIAWVVCMLVYALLKNNFVMIKVNAGIILVFSLITHLKIYNLTKEKGSRLIVLGILISFLSIIVHSLKLSFSDWFNYKDIAHVIIVISLYVIFTGVKANAEKQSLKV
jgi:hypothetical protein